MGMHKHGGTKNRGRTPGASNLLAPNPTHPNVPQTLRADGAGSSRGRANLASHTGTMAAGAFRRC